MGWGEAHTPRPESLADDPLWQAFRNSLRPTYIDLAEDADGRFVYLDGGTLDFGIIRDRPWRWWERPHWAWRAWLRWRRG